MTRSAAIALAAGLAACTTAHAQTFNRVIGLASNEVAYAVEQTRDGGYVTVGFINEPTSNDRADILVVKYDPAGMVMWVSRFGGPGTDIGYSIQQTRDGGYIVGAETDSQGALTNLALLKLDPVGNYQWSWVYEGDLSGEDGVYTTSTSAAPGVSVRESPLEGYLLTGRKRLSQTNQQGVLVRTTLAGNPIFNLRYNDTRFGDRSMLSFIDVRPDPNGTFVVSGTENDFVAGTGSTEVDPILLRVAANGAPIWARDYRLISPVTNTFERGTSDGMDLCRNGDIVWDGRSDLGISGAINLQAMRTDPNGNIRWFQVYQRDGSAYRSIREDAELRIATGGWKGSVTASSAMLLLMQPGTGLPIFQRTYDFLNRAMGIVPTPLSNGYALTGPVSVAVGFGNQDIELIHTDPAGFVGCLDAPADPSPVRPNVEPLTMQLVVQQQAATFWQGEFRRWQLRDELLCRPCPACPADFNEDGGVDGSDVAAFFDAWQNGLPCADVNQDGGIDGQDVATFHFFWENGGC